MRSSKNVFAVCLCIVMQMCSWQIEASMFDDLSKELELSEQQQKNVKVILDVEARQLLELKGSSLDAVVKKEQFRIIQQRTLDRLSSILTSEQQRLYARFLTERKEKIRTKKQKVKTSSETDWVSDE